MLKSKIIWGLNVLLYISIVIGLILYFLKPPYTTESSFWGFKFDLDQIEYPSYVEDWIKDCDAKGNGFYALKLPPSKAKFMMQDDPIISDEKGKNNDSYFVCVYFNQGDGDKTIKITNYGGGTGFIYIPYESTTNEGGKNSILTGVYAFNLNIKELKIFLDGEEVNYFMEELK